MERGTGGGQEQGGESWGQPWALPCPRVLFRSCLYLQLSEMASLYGFLSEIYILPWFWNQLSFELMIGSPICDLVKI